MRIGEGLVFGTALTAAAITAGCSAEQPAAPAPTSSPETTATPRTSEQCVFVIGGVALRDKGTKAFEITSLYSGKVAPGDVCEPKPNSEASVIDLDHIFSPEENTGQRVHVGSQIIAKCISNKPSLLGIETGAGRQDAVSFYNAGGVETQITAALGGPLPDCFDLPAPKTK